MFLPTTNFVTEDKWANTLGKSCIGLGAILSFALWSFTTSSFARPVSYPEGWTLELDNNDVQNSALVHYTLDTNHALGLRTRYDRDGDFTFIGAQLNRLIKRWNNSDSQANIYGHAALGALIDDQSGPLTREDDVGFFLGLSADWESRKYFASANAEHWDNGRFGDFSRFRTRLGLAPYVANTGALHTWIFIEGRYRPQRDNELSGAALLRFFKGPALLEVGIDDQGEPLLNYVHAF